MIDHIGAIDQGIGDGREIDTLKESDLQIDDGGAGNEISVIDVTGEMTPEIGIEDAARILLTRTRDIEVMTFETGLREEIVQKPAMYVYISPKFLCVKMQKYH